MSAEPEKAPAPKPCRTCGDAKQIAFHDKGDVAYLPCPDCVPSETPVDLPRLQAERIGTAGLGNPLMTLVVA